MLPAQVSYWTLQENKRHNLVTEDQGDRTIAETVRSNKAREFETNRHNVETERETNRHNTVTEWETNRSNVVREMETERSNRAREFETTRHNTQTEKVGFIDARSHETSAKASAISAKVKADAERRAQEMHPYQKKLAITSTSTPWLQAIASVVGATAKWK